MSPATGTDSPLLAPQTTLPWEKENYADLHWMPQAIRFKLDTAGLKIGLKTWQALALQDRQSLLQAPFATPDHKQTWAQHLAQSLSRHNLGEPAAITPLESFTVPSQNAIAAWQAAGFDLTAPFEKLSDYGRYLAIKLVKAPSPNQAASRPEHVIAAAALLGLPKVGATFSHVDAEGRPGMVDVSHKAETLRRARAQARIYLPEIVRQAAQGQDLLTKKGSAFQAAILAGTMAAKKTWDLIPLCHALPLDACRIECRMEGEEALIEAEVATRAATGVEMEALTAVSVAALTLYDMTKALSHAIVIREIRLLHKTGGKSDYAAT